MASARDRLKLLAPCLVLRETQLRFAQGRALEARRQNDAADHALQTARRQADAGAALMNQRLTGGSLTFDALNLHALRAAVSALEARAVDAAARQIEVEQLVESRRSEVSAANGACQALERSLTQARRQALRGEEEKQLAAAEDLRAARRISR